jgi:hypothetical protein
LQLAPLQPDVQYAAHEKNHEPGNDFCAHSTPTTNTRCTTMTGPSKARPKWKHLSDIDIGKILGLAKTKSSQRKIASLMKCSQKAVQNTLATYLFETFQGRKEQREYQHKTTEREDRHIEHILKQNDTVPLRDITNIINPDISDRTLRQR